MSGWEWLAFVAAAVGLPLAVVYAIQGSLADAYRRGYEEGAEEGYQKGFFEALGTVRTHSTQGARSAKRKGQKKADGDGNSPPA